jgi:hypothetical protein
MPDLSNYPTGLFIQNPTEIQSRRMQTIQTHNAVSVGANSNSQQASYFDCDGFDKLACTFLNDSSTASWVNVYWSNDGTTMHAFETLIASGTQQQKAGITDIKGRYAKLTVGNSDASAHTMSAWAYLKA